MFAPFLVPLILCTAADEPIPLVRIELPEPVSPVMDRIAVIAARHIESRTVVPVVRSGHAAFSLILATDPALRAEGFEIADTPGGVRIAGANERSVLYGLGKFLRTSRYSVSAFVPSAWRGASTPDGAFRAVYAATHFNNFYEAAPAHEVSRYIEDLALWGANTVIVHFPTWSFEGFDDPHARRNIEQTQRLLQAAKAVGMMTGLVQCPNQGFVSAPAGTRAMPNPDEWQRRGNTGVNCCPSRPEGKPYLLDLYARLFAEYQDIGLDYLICWPYDEGGCGCEACAPWGAKAFPDLSKSVAALGRNVFPNLKMILSTWLYDTPPEGEWEGLAASLQADHAWVDAIMCDDHFDFPRYPLERGVPAGLPLYNFPEISMWGRNPWGAYGANPLPMRYEALWKQTKGKVSGGMPYSEGIFEDINKAICLQFYWNRNAAAEETLREYAAFEFSPESVDDVVTAVRLLEAAWIERGPKSEQAFALIESVNATLPSWAKSGWRWRLVYLRGLIDSELVRNGGKLEGSLLKSAFTELTSTYHAANAHAAVRPHRVP